MGFNNVSKLLSRVSNDTDKSNKAKHVYLYWSKLIGSLKSRTWYCGVVCMSNETFQSYYFTNISIATFYQYIELPFQSYYFTNMSIATFYQYI